MPVAKNLKKNVLKAFFLLGDVCKETWRKLRDNYRKAKQLRKTKSGQSAKKIKPIKFEKELAFLDPHLQQPQELQTSNLLVPSSGDDSDADGSSQQLTEGFSEPPTPDSAKSVASTSTCHLSRSKRKREHVQHSPMQEYLQFKREQQVSSQTNAHPLDVFFSSMAATVKTFPAPTQLNIKRQVFQLVTDAEATLTHPAPPENAIPGPSHYAVQAKTSALSLHPNNAIFTPPEPSEYAGQSTNENQLLNLDDYRTSTQSYYHTTSQNFSK